MATRDEYIFGNPIINERSGRCNTDRSPALPLTEQNVRLGQVAPLAPLRAYNARLIRLCVVMRRETGVLRSERRRNIAAELSSSVVKDGIC